ncbi:MAG: outer membrane beta-barrel family protein [Candidatus Hatepunaea meridiana]|nr:outer membrane beta-barrel family protein [Candidatus Hatepunaea meridiana]
MYFRYSTVLVALLVFATVALSQESQSGRDFSSANKIKLVIKGRILDATFESPLEYANIVLYSQKDSAKITGDATDKNGYFELIGFPPGQYFIRLSFIGFIEKTIDNIRIGQKKPTLNLGDITLNRKVFTMQEAGVTLTRPEIEFKIDKKIINVDKQYTAASGTAVDVLEATPSVSVDIEGNVSLRGSSNFSVLVDGQPSMLDPNDILQQVAAGTIQNIEIITNPSAKYEAEGSSGIINIILKKNKLQGISAIVNSNTGIYDTYGGDAQIGYMDSKYSYNIGVDYNNKNNPGTLTNKLQTYYPGTTLYVNSEGDNSRNRLRAGVKGSFGYNLTDKDHISLGLRYGQGNMDSESDLDFTEWTEPGVGARRYSSLGDSKREMGYTSVTLTYKHNFDQEFHNLSILTNYGQRKIEGESDSELFDNNNQAVEGKTNTENRTSNRYRLQIDYTKPLQEGYKFEAGYHNTYGKPEDETELFVLNTATGQYELQPLFSHQTDYVRDIRSLYLMYSGEYRGLGFQSGLRGEYTYRHIESISANQETSIEHWDYFPSIHLSYSIDDANQVATSYSRRIQRPRRWNLEPFETWTNAYNVRKGNPSLKPEYIDSYELSYQKKYDKNNSLSAEVYYRKNSDRIEQISSVYSEGITLNTYENAGVDHSIGAEIMLNLGILKWWKVNATYNIYRFESEGEINNIDYTAENVNWTTRLNNVIRFGKTTRFQLNGSYTSPTVSSQSEIKGYFTSSLAVKYEIIPETLSTTLQVKDVFSTAKRESTTEGTGFTQYTLMESDAPVFLLNLSYIFNNYKTDRKSSDDIDTDDF